MRCLMLGARSSGRPAAPGSSSSDSSADEVSQLDHYLQTQLEEDIARIFDESIYSDIELVCGKHKIQTHSCILKARTYKFYHELEAILHVNVNVGHNTFDELYSFISDAYTECNIQQQEKQIIQYLKETLNLENTVKSSSKSKLEEKEDPDVYSTPNCVSPEEKSFQKAIIGGSPSTELTKEFYALVPIEGDVLDRELIEQDALSDAFQSIKKEDKNKFNELIKPNSLNLSKVSKHSSNCDILLDTTKVTDPEEKKFNNGAAYTPDSLVTDEPSSSSDYLSAAYAVSPVFSNGFSHVNATLSNVTIMDNVATISDSGLETAESLNLSHNSHKDVTLTDLSLTENTLNDINERYREPSSNVDQLHAQIIKRSASLHSPTCGSSTAKQLNDRKCNKSSTDICEKIFKERQNEEIVLLESSSVSSETGSWESVFPPKLADKEINDNNETNEPRHTIKTDAQKITESITDKPLDNLCTSLVQKSPFKSTSCFIDAASLADEEDEVLNIQPDSGTQTDNFESSPPVACTSKPDELSENDDSLEQTDNKSIDSMQKEQSPNIYEVPFDTLSIKSCESTTVTVLKVSETLNDSGIDNSSIENVPSRNECSTPNNSIICVRNPRFKDHENENKHKELVKTHENDSGYNNMYSHDSPRTQRKIENIPIVSGAYIPEPEPEVIQDKQPKSLSNSSFWVVDMSSSSSTENCSRAKTDKPVDKTVGGLKSASKPTNDENYKSRSSVDSDGSEKSTQKFYIDLSTLPDALPPEPKQDDHIEKKNIFSMYIDLDDKSSVPKEIPARFCSSSNSKKSKPDTKSCSKSPKTPKKSSMAVEVSADCTVEDTSLFEKLESLCANQEISISEIVIKTKFSEKDSETSKISPKEKNLSKDVIAEEAVVGDFVKLSDLDKPAPKVDPSTLNRKEDHNRMTRSIPDNDWRHLSETSCLRSTDIISSFHSENAISLNRLFPHLKNDFSRSMPGSLSTKSKTPLPMTPTWSAASGVVLTPDGEVTNSAQSSYCRYILGDSSTESDQTSGLINSCQSRLGQDLLRMFIEEIAPDVIVEVSGRRIKAHKCILASRCQYFAAIFSGRRVENSGNIICLPQNFSYNAVHFALCHIYSGVSTIPENVSIVELATLADMFCLEGLKEGIMFVLRNKYCHGFHQPCAVCIAGVLESFPLAAVYGLDDLYRKCLRWITKYFPRVWPTKAFATLPSELSHKCCQELIVNMSLDNVVEYACGVGITLASLPRSRWVDVVEHLCRKLMHAVCEFAAASLCAVLRAVEAVPPSAPFAASSAAVHELRAAVVGAMDRARPAELCRAYVLLEQLEHVAPTSLLDACLRAWRLHAEVAVVASLRRTAAAPALRDLPPRLLARLRDLGCISMQAELECGSRAPRPTAAPRRQPSAPAALRRPVTAPVAPRRQPAPATRTVRSADIDQVRACFVPYAQRPQPQPRLGSVTSLAERDARGNKPAKTQPTAARNGSKKEKIVPSVRTTKAQEKRAKYNSSKTLSQPVEPTAVKPVRSAYENAKPRYLEARGSRAGAGAVAGGAARRAHPRMVSSSESSRNASPVLARARPRTADPSSDSLSQASHDKFATYTRSKGSVESVTVSSTKLQSTKPAVRGSAKSTKIPVYLNRSPKPSVSSDGRRSQREKAQGESQESAQPRETTTQLERSGTFLMLLGPTNKN